MYVTSNISKCSWCLKPYIYNSMCLLYYNSSYFDHIIYNRMEQMGKQTVLVYWKCYFDGDNILGLNEQC